MKPAAGLLAAALLSFGQHVASPPPLLQQLTDGTRMIAVAGTQSFAVGVEGSVPVAVTQIEEMLKPETLPRFAYFVQNRSAAAVRAYSVMAVIVARDGTIKSRQPLKGKTLKPGQVVRQEFAVRSLLAASDLVGFAVAEVDGDDGTPVKVDAARLDEMFGAAARQLRR